MLVSSQKRALFPLLCLNNLQIHISWMFAQSAGLLPQLCALCPGGDISKLVYMTEFTSCHLQLISAHQPRQCPLIQSQKRIHMGFVSSQGWP